MASNLTTDIRRPLVKLLSLSELGRDTGVNFASLTMGPNVDQITSLSIRTASIAAALAVIRRIIKICERGVLRRVSITFNYLNGVDGDSTLPHSLYLAQ